VQDLASKVGGGEQQRPCPPGTALQLQRFEVARYREERTTHWIGIWRFKLVEISSVADTKHPRIILHLLSALQGQAVDELHLLCRGKKKQSTFSSFAIFDIAVCLVLESFAPLTLHSDVL
jgi:hypothetical protein